MKLYLKVMWVGIKYYLPVLLSLLPLLALVGAFVEWEQDNEIIQRSYPEYSDVLAGYSYETLTFEGVTTSTTQRSYWLIPKSISSPMMLSINYDKEGNASHQASIQGFWFSVVTFVLIGFAFYVVWVRDYDPFNRKTKDRH